MSHLKSHILHVTLHLAHFVFQMTITISHFKFYTSRFIFHMYFLRCTFSLNFGPLIINKRIKTGLLPKVDSCYSDWLFREPEPCKVLRWRCLASGVPYKQWPRQTDSQGGKYKVNKYTIMILSWSDPCDPVRPASLGRGHATMQLWRGHSQTSRGQELAFGNQTRK